MRTSFKILVCFMAAALLFAACSAETVVSSRERVESATSEPDDVVADENAPDDGTNGDDSASTAESGSSVEESSVDGDGSNDANTGDTNTGDGETGDTNTLDGNTVDGETDDGNTLDGDTGDGNSVDGDTGEGETGDGDAVDGDTGAAQTPGQLEEAPGFGLGGSEQLESLQADCESGNNLACDILFQLSDFDSEEEVTALTCGGRGEAQQTFCTAGITALPETTVLDPESDGIDAIVDLCETNGDMTACDFLYFRSPIDSDVEAIGASCGGRVAVAVPDCRTFLSEE